MVVHEVTRILPERMRASRAFQVRDQRKEAREYALRHGFLQDVHEMLRNAVHLIDRSC